MSELSTEDKADAINATIHGLCGFEVTECPIHLRYDCCGRTGPLNYCGSLNAMHIAEETIIKRGLTEEYTDNLERICYINRSGITYDKYTEGVGDGHVEWFHATAIQRAEALIDTLSLPDAP